MPPWADELGRVTPLRAVTLVDSWGDHFIVWVDFERPDGEARGVGVEVAATASGPKADLLYGPPIEQFAERAEGPPAHDHDPRSACPTPERPSRQRSS